jgi:hypothetical protein
MMEVDAEIALRAMKDDGEVDDSSETAEPSDPFYRDEMAIAALLGGLWLALTAKVRPSLDAALTGRYDANTVHNALATVGAQMSDVVTSSDVVKVRNIVDSLIIKGAKEVRGGGSSGNAGIVNHIGPATVGKGTILEDAPSAKQVLDGIVDAVKYYTNNHFNTQIVPAIQSDIAKLIADSTHTPDLTPIREALDKRLASVPYWKLVANAAASRGFHYGMMKAGQLTQASSYTWVAVMDDKTSQICRDLNGREFRIADAVSLVERASAATPEEARKMMPWPTSAQRKAIPTMTNDQLRDMGFLVPPAHGNCRSTIRLNYR